MLGSVLLCGVPIVSLRAPGQYRTGAGMGSCITQLKAQGSPLGHGEFTGAGRGSLAAVRMLPEEEGMSMIAVSLKLVTPSKPETPEPKRLIHTP